MTSDSPLAVVAQSVVRLFDSSYNFTQFTYDDPWTNTFGSHTKHQLVAYWFFALLGLVCCIVMLIIGRGARRSWIQTTFWTSLIVFAVSQAFLLFSGQGFRIWPNQALCTVDAALADGSIAFVLTAFIAMCAQELYNVTNRGGNRIQLGLLIFMPVVFFFLWLIIALAAGFADSSLVDRGYGALHCTLVAGGSRWPWNWWSTILWTATLVISTVLLVITQCARAALTAEERMNLVPNLVQNSGFLGFLWFISIFVVISLVSSDDGYRFIPMAFIPFVAFLTYAWDGLFCGLACCCGCCLCCPRSNNVAGARSAPAVDNAPQGARVDVVVQGLGPHHGPAPHHPPPPPPHFPHGHHGPVVVRCGACC